MERTRNIRQQGVPACGGIAGHTTHEGRGAACRSVVAVLGLALALCAFAALSVPADAHPARPTHATPTSTDPAARALLQAPPSAVKIVFSEDVNSATSRIIVVDPANREVDNRDSQVSSVDARQLSVTLPLLPVGTYVVVWKVQSADDGHVTRGSYYFQIARPDGSAPPLPTQLPTGNVPVGGGTGAESAILDGPTLLQALATWLALLFATFWIGGVLWETWILPPDRPDLDPDLAAAAGVAAERFRRFAAPSLTLLLLSNVLIVLAQSAAIAGDWSGLLAPQLLRAILFGSHFGLFWWGRELTALAALILLVVAEQNGWSWTRATARAAAANGKVPAAAIEAEAIPDWRRELLGTLRDIRHLPGQLVAGWRHRSSVGRAELVLAVLLLLAFALSGHAASVPTNIFFPAIAVDVLHLLGDAAWLGGLFYIGVVLVPAIASLPLRRRARFLALGLPQFGALAILSAVVLAATGSVNATIRMTSFAQLITTAYGRTLAIKIELFLVMVAISAYHAFWLRPRLAQALVATPETQAAAETTPETESALVGTVGAAGATHAPAQEPIPPADGVPRGTGGARTDADIPRPGRADADVRGLAVRLEGWLRREAIIGVAVLLCVALLGAYAGTLAAAPAGPPPSTSGAGGPFVSQPQRAGAYSVVLKVTPATFGPNTFTALVTDAQGRPLTGATVLAQTTSLDMDMGSENIELKERPNAAGSYSGQGDLTMGGNWGVAIKVLAPGAGDYVSTTFKFVVGY
jgi:putative copper export protein/methionine-rich copper-binding protein CopC